MAFIRYAGVMKGIVVDTTDPTELGRIKIRIPQFHGFVKKESYGPIKEEVSKYAWISDEYLPWAEVCYPYGSTTQPEINQVVWVSFVNGDKSYPVVMGWAGYEYTTEEEMLTAQ